MHVLSFISWLTHIPSVEPPESQSDVVRISPRPPSQGHLPVQLQVHLFIIQKLKPCGPETFIQTGSACSTSHLRAIYLAQTAIAHDVFHSLKLPSKPNLQLPQNSAKGPTVALGPETHTGYGNGGQSSGFKRRKTSNTTFRKTLRQNDDDDDEIGEDNDRRPNNQRNKPDDAQDPSASKLLACPFQKLDPQEYYSRCGNKQLTTIDRVKQHLKRNHFLDGSPCDKCWQTFDDDEELRHHTSTRECVPSQGPDELFEEDLALLDTGRGLSPEHKWFQLWDQLCPGHDRPLSPYIEYGIDELNDYISRSHASLPHLQAQFSRESHPDVTARIVHALTEMVRSEYLSDRRHRRPAPTPPEILPTGSSEVAPINEDAPIDGAVPGDGSRQDYPAIHLVEVDPIPPPATGFELPNENEGLPGVHVPDESTEDLLNNLNFSVSDLNFSVSEIFDFDFGISSDMDIWGDINEFPPNAEFQDNTEEV